jgi:hypothetical protein
MSADCGGSTRIIQVIKPMERLTSGAVGAVKELKYGW